MIDMCRPRLSRVRQTSCTTLPLPCCRSKGQTDGRTPYRYIDAHGSEAASVNTGCLQMQPNQFPRNFQEISRIHTHLLKGPWVSRYQKGKPIWILLKQETVYSTGISWAIYKSAPHSRQITTPATEHSVFYRPDALPAAQPTASKH